MKGCMPYTVASIEAGLTLLETIADHPGLGVTALARMVGGSKSQAFRLLHTLEHRGYVIKDPTTRGYRLGYRPMFVGERAKQQTNLISRAQPFLEGLAAASRENVHLIVREGLRSVCVGLSESPQNLRLYAQLGRQGPLHAGGASKVLLAFAPADVRAEVLATPLERFNQATITDPVELSRVLDTIVRDGYHLALGDIDENAFAVSAPIRDHRDEVVAALSIAGPMYRLDPDALARHRESVLACSLDISRALR